MSLTRSQTKPQRDALGQWSTHVARYTSPTATFNLAQIPTSTDGMRVCEWDWVQNPIFEDDICTDAWDILHGAIDNIDADRRLTAEQAERAQCAFLDALVYIHRISTTHVNLYLRENRCTHTNFGF